jgi:hypothetical protein
MDKNDPRHPVKRSSSRLVCETRMFVESGQQPFVLWVYPMTQMEKEVSTGVIVI